MPDGEKYNYGENFYEVFSIFCFVPDNENMLHYFFGGGHNVIINEYMFVEVCDFIRFIRKNLYFCSGNCIKFV